MSDCLNKRSLGSVLIVLMGGPWHGQTHTRPDNDLYGPVWGHDYDGMLPLISRKARRVGPANWFDNGRQRVSAVAYEPLKFIVETYAGHHQRWVVLHVDQWVANQPQAVTELCRLMSENPKWWQSPPTWPDAPAYFAQYTARDWHLKWARAKVEYYQAGIRGAFRTSCQPRRRHRAQPAAAKAYH